METKAKDYYDELKLLVLEDDEVFNKLDHVKANLLMLETFLNGFDFERKHRAILDSRLEKIKVNFLEACALLRKNQIPVDLDE